MTTGELEKALVRLANTSAAFSADEVRDLDRAIRHGFATLRRERDEARAEGWKAGWEACRIEAAKLADVATPAAGRCSLVVAKVAEQIRSLVPAEKET
jgi:hypothetical protein